MHVIMTFRGTTTIYPTPSEAIVTITGDQGPAEVMLSRYDAASVMGTYDTEVRDSVETLQGAYRFAYGEDAVYDHVIGIRNDVITERAKRVVHDCEKLLELRATQESLSNDVITTTRNSFDRWLCATDWLYAHDKSADDDAINDEDAVSKAYERFREWSDSKSRRFSFMR